MKPEKITFYAYAEDENQVKHLQNVLNDFVREQYNKGILVTADKLAGALQAFGNNYFVINYLKSR